MQIKYKKIFRLHFEERIVKNRNLTFRFREHLRILQANPEDPALNDHPLQGPKKHLRSFSITGDIRVIYRRAGDTILLYDIGSHNQVY